ncbi:glycosyltransferase family 4 protein [Oscillatoria sp. FACHB-1406]|uniref:glycosyltransferase family 4 protein n=1 Tax=Oscillatoria sp. FACHB-1406 TaxID=2692846 RepID=UPI001686EA6C|nr:glycosyltransferase family 4 protein [Oscillatoria sp. FACHB-1406]MBD2577555.1 glycosyltransferase family 4 protein [Oscillatoria sp. FACHB-1406]
MLSTQRARLQGILSTFNPLVNREKIPAIAPEPDAKRQINRSPRYAFVFLEILNQEGGIQSYVRDIFQAYLSGEGNARADVFLLRDRADCDNPFNLAPLNFHYFGNRTSWRGRANLLTALFKFLLLHHPDRVFCGHINLAPPIQHLCQLLGIPYTVLTYGKEVWEELNPAKTKALQNAAEIWTISRYSRDRACEMNDIEPSKVKFLPCVVDGSVFTPAPKSPQLVQQYDLEGAKVLMTVARLWSGDRYKGVDVTIRALPEIAKAFPNVKYLVIGRGDDQPRLQQLAQDLGVGDRVVFAGFVPTEALPDHYRLADAYIMPSQEGFGIVYLEAMACGIPALSGDSDGSADPLQDGKVGWRVPHRDSAAVAAACIEILKGEDPRCNGEWLREQCLAKFSKEALARQLQTLLQA